MTPDRPRDESKRIAASAGERHMKPVACTPPGRAVNERSVVAIGQ